MNDRMTVGETYDSLLKAWELGLKAFSNASMIAIQSLKKNEPVSNIEFIDSILQFNHQTASYFKQLIEEDIMWKTEEASVRAKEHADRIIVSLNEHTSIFNTIKEANNRLNRKRQQDESNTDDMKLFAIRLADNKSYVEFHCADLNENGIIPAMPLVIGKDRMSLESNIPAIVNHVKRMVLNEKYNTVLYECDDLAIYCELAAEIRNIPELIFVETDSDHR